MPSVRQARTSNEQVRSTTRLTPEGRCTYQASYERMKSIGVQIDGKRVANFEHLSDLDGHARVEVEQALPAGEIFRVSD
eukprot:3566294-Pleurochrysis_carterae.AAC.1